MWTPRFDWSGRWDTASSPTPGITLGEGVYKIGSHMEGVNKFISTVNLKKRELLPVSDLVC